MDLINVIDYVVQIARFQVFEEYGCTNLEAASILSLLLVNVWSVLLPMISAVFYCRKPHPLKRLQAPLIIKSSKNPLEVLSPTERDQSVHIE